GFPARRRSASSSAASTRRSSIGSSSSPCARPSRLRSRRASRRPDPRVREFGHGYHRTVAVTTEAKLDARKLREDFPAFEHPMHEKPLAYLDSASSSQKP